MPLALTREGELVRAASARSTRAKRCPACLGRVIVRNGRLAHFAAGRACPPPDEGWPHAAAKHVVALVARRFARGLAPSPSLLRSCACCGTARHGQPLPATVRDAVVEAALPGLRADVVLVGERGAPLLVVEIMNSWPLDDARVRALGRLPWIELRAAEVLEHPREWRPLRAANLRPWRCSCAGLAVPRVAAS